MTECAKCGSDIDADECGTAHNHLTQSRELLCDACMDSSDEHHDASECASVFGLVCAHPDCARRVREIAAFRREMEVTNG